MKNLFLVCIVMISLWGGSAVSQTYNEEEIRQQLDKYIENPKLFFEKQKADKEKADKANQNTLKVSEEYLGLMDKKDSLLKLYKTQLSKVKSSSPAAASINSSPTTSSIATKTTIAPKPAAVSTPYRVQLAAFYRDDFSKFFGTFNKTIGVEKVDNRNVIEVQGFKDSLEALEFSQKIKKLGFGGAFVTKYDANGIREEGYKVNKNGAKFAYGDEPATAKSVEYPNYVPNGYQEIKGQKASPSISSSQVKAAAAPAKNVEYPSQVPAGYQEIKGQKPNPANGLQNPQISKKQILSSASPTPATAPAPKTLANVTPPPAPKPASKDKADQLDAAFDQLFKR
jgi:hypothetical protein